MSSKLIYPLLFEPVFKDYIWGGRNLERLFGRSLPPGITAESWEIAGHEDGTTTVKNGYFLLHLQHLAIMTFFWLLTTRSMHLQTEKMWLLCKE